MKFFFFFLIFLFYLFLFYLNRKLKLNIGFIISETGENATVIGWGETSSGGSPSRILQEVNVTVVSNTKCKKAYDEIKLLVNRQTLYHMCFK